MQNESKRGHHTTLVVKMADKQGVDLAERIMRAEFSIDDMDRAVDRCLGCIHPEACGKLLDTDAPRVSLPDYCRNGATFDALKTQ